MIELGQDRKIAALKSSVCVHFFLEVFMSLKDDKYYFNLALKEAKRAAKSNNVPIGCVIVFNNRVIAKAYNKKNSKNVSIYHAEILAMIKACRFLNTFILEDCTMYVTLEPCKMCMNAMAESRIRNVKYLISSRYGNNLKSNYDRIKCKQYYNNEYIDEYSDMLSKFFKNVRS